MRLAYERLEQMGEKALLATTAAHLARVLYALERYGEAEQFCSVSESAAAAEDVVSQVIWRGARAKILARQGRVDEAEALVAKRPARLADRSADRPQRHAARSGRSPPPCRTPECRERGRS